MSGRKGAEIRGAGSALPADILKLQPNDSPSWETPRPVRKDGPGGKYRERKVKKKKVSMATRMKAKKRKGRKTESNCRRFAKYVGGNENFFALSTTVSS
jgi:hypothetical protein